MEWMMGLAAYARSSSRKPVMDLAAFAGRFKRASMTDLAAHPRST